jgi:hypothetical protein
MKEKINFLLGTDVFSHLTNMKYIPRWLVLLLDIFLCLFSYYVSYFIASKLYDKSLDIRVLTYFQQFGVVVGLQIIFFWIFHRDM